jgi:hypothetical protein
MWHLLPNLRYDTSTAGHGSDNQKRLGPRRDRLEQWHVGRFVGQILLTGEQSQVRPALLRDVIAGTPSYTNLFPTGSHVLPPSLDRWISCPNQPVDCDA